MSQYYFILKLLNLKDENITFSDNPYSERIIKGVRSQVFHAKLTYKPNYCACCGHVMDENIIKHGFKTSLITLPIISGMNAHLELKKQRMLCRHCNSTFTLSTPIVEPNCYISNNTKLAITLESADKISECDLAKRHNVSHSTVNRIIANFYETHKPHSRELPENMCFDEFKSVKAAKGAMSFIYCDADNGNLIDVVEDRRLDSLRAYFLRYPKENRDNVKSIVIDMYTPYITLIREVFPKANIVLDKFHIVQLISRALNKTRIAVMNDDKDNYNKLKRYWKLLLKRRSDVDYKNYRYFRCFKGMMCEEDVLNYLLSISNELRDTYEVYQDILSCIEKKDKNKDIKVVDEKSKMEFREDNKKRFNMIMDKLKKNYKRKGKNKYEHEDYPNLSNYMRTALKSLNENRMYVLNMMDSDYTNARVEGLINKIKVIKRIAFGFRSFVNFKARILITEKMLNIQKGPSNVYVA